jgi:isoleucyl-tRNA synthetase
VQNFCVVDLSNFYLDIAKDRLYISHTNAFRRRSCQTVLAIAVESLAKAIAPVLSHMAEDIWQFLPYKTPYKSVFESGWVKMQPEWQKPELVASWASLRSLRNEVNKVMEQARVEKAIGSSLDAKVLLYVSDDQLKKKLASFNPTDSLSSNGADELRYFFLASQVELVDSVEIIEKAEYNSKDNTVSIGIVKAEGAKCAAKCSRCWNYSTHVGEFPEDPTICERCNAALAGEF